MAKMAQETEWDFFFVGGGGDHNEVHGLWKNAADF